ncbi:MAG: hypothetical protein ABIG94_01620 [Pseudomonadota bacterium]
MNLEQVSRWRTILGKVGAAFCLLMFLALLDALIVHFREPVNVFRVLPGTTTEINGSLPEDVQGVKDLTYTSDSMDLRLSFEEVHHGYFLGGNMWRGQFLVSPEIQPGKYRLTVTPRSNLSSKPPPAFRILVYPDAASRQQSFKSLIRRHTGISPWRVAVSCLPVILLAFGLVYYLSAKREALLARTGKAEIYRVLKRDDGYEILFALGTAQGLGAGSFVNILNERGQAVGTARVEESNSTDSVALAAADQEIKTGYLVSVSGP